jgi:flagellar hook assembly protein FlgD
MNTLDAIARGEKASSAADLASQVELLTNLGVTGVTAETYTKATKEQMATWAATAKAASKNTPVIISKDELNTAYSDDDLYEKNDDGTFKLTEDGKKIAKAFTPSEETGVVATARKDYYEYL